MEFPGSWLPAETLQWSIPCASMPREGSAFGAHSQTWILGKKQTAQHSVSMCLSSSRIQWTAS